jgi:DNA-binding NtrC family response regulator
LLIDDAPEVKDYVGRALPSGCSLDYAGNLAVGVQMAEATEYDLIITDLMMPDVNEGDVLTILLRQFPGTPVMVLTQLHSPYTASLMLRQGAMDVSFKPDKSMPIEIAHRQLGEAIVFAKARYDYHSQQMVSNSANAAAIEDLKREMRELRKDRDRLLALELQQTDDAEEMRGLWAKYEAQQTALSLREAEREKGKWGRMAQLIALAGTGLAALIPWALSKWGKP